MMMSRGYIRGGRRKLWSFSAGRGSFPPVKLMEACEDDLVEAREDGLVEACEDDLVKAKYEDISDFDKGQIVMARRLGLSISKTAGLVGCSQNAVVSIYKKWCKEGHPLTRRQGRVYPKALLRGGRKGPLKREGSEG